ncbi:hypothetical protein SPBR_07702 [Sporothrix brasiliensis 5110]|uniref:Uncharacterized protein n=1 Tax=Sporothrix brasiliensis 5110 TaxID=1398154 RepID=A0A0C2IWV4_9PEZI|nr:uncharacterized protein SPBR_07702 [Sporothrix brasiliensis 5110]KIH89507.1 hypothetical protein SPBR_07702 [Sporothrix brasiliensis 5110]
MFAQRIMQRQRPAAFGQLFRRSFGSTLSINPHIKAFRLATLPPSYLLTYLDTPRPSAVTAVGTTSVLPPTPRSFVANDRFMDILNDVLRENAAQDDGLRAQAVAFAAPGGTIFSNAGASHTGSSTTVQQGGSGGGGVGGWVHLSDLRNPPDFGRIAWPEDIFGSIEVDSTGTLLDNFQPSGSYRILTNEGMLGLSDFLREKLVQRLEEEDENDTSDRPQILD